MKRILIAVAALCLNSALYAQTGVRYDGRVTVAGTNAPVNANVPLMAVPNATVTICSDGACQDPTIVYSNQALTVSIGSSLKTDGQGKFGFYASSGSYFYQVQLPSGTIQGIFPITLGGSGASITPSIPVLASNSSGAGVAASASGVAGLFGCTSTQILNGAGGCSTNGGSVLGQQYRISGFTGSGSGSSTALGQTNSFTDATGNPLTVPGALGAYTTNGMGNTDLTGGIAANLSSPTASALMVPPNSSDTYSLGGLPVTPGFAPINFYDYRLNSTWEYHVNPGTASPGNSTNVGHGINCQFGALLTAGYGFYQCAPSVMVKQGGGVNLEDSWTNVQQFSLVGTFQTRGQKYMQTTISHFFGGGDQIRSENEGTFRAACTDSSGECIKEESSHMVEVLGPSGTVTSYNSSTLRIAPNWTSLGTNVGDGEFVVNTTAPTYTGGNISLNTAGGTVVPSLYNSTVTLTPSPWQATVSSGCGATTQSDEPASAACTVSVTVNTTAPTAGSVVCFADPSRFEQAAVVSLSGSTLTVKVRYTHSAGTPVMYGGTCGLAAILLQGETAYTGLADPIPYMGGGSPSASTTYVVMNVLGNQLNNEELPIPSNNAGSLSGCTLNRSGSTVSTSCQIPPIYNGFSQVSSASPITVTGNSCSDLNGTITGAITTNRNGSSWTMAGTCTTGTGGSLQMTNMNNFAMYPAAETTAVNPDGTVTVEANNAGFAAGQAIYQMNHYATQVNSKGEEVNVLTQSPTGGNVIHESELGGFGLYNASYIELDNENFGEELIGSGGTNNGLFSFAEVRVPYQSMFSATYAPLNGGTYGSIGCPYTVGGNAVCTANSPAYSFYSFAGYNSYLQTQYDPVTNTFSFFGGGTNATLYTQNFTSSGTVNIGGTVNLSGTVTLPSYFARTDTANTFGQIQTISTNAFSGLNVISSGFYGAALNIQSTEQTTSALQGWDLWQTGNFGGPTGVAVGSFVIADQQTNISVFAATDTGDSTLGLPMAMGTGSTVNNTSGVPELICLADGTNCTTSSVVPSPQFQLPYYSAGGSGSALTGDSQITTDGAGTLSAYHMQLSDTVNNAADEYFTGSGGDSTCVVTTTTGTFNNCIKGGVPVVSVASVNSGAFSPYLTAANVIAGANITLTPSSTGLTIAATGGGSGSGTVNSGTAFSPTYYPATGTAVSGTTPFTGFGYFSTSAAPTAATATQAATLISGLTGCTTAGYVFTPQGNDCVANSATVAGFTFTPNTTGFSIAAGTTSKTLTINNTMTLAGTDSLTYTFPTTSGSLCVISGSCSITGGWSFAGNSLKVNSVPIYAQESNVPACTGAETVTAGFSMWSCQITGNVTGTTLAAPGTGAGMTVTLVYSQTGSNTFTAVLPSNIISPSSLASSTITVTAGKRSIYTLEYTANTSNGGPGWIQLSSEINQ